MAELRQTVVEKVESLRDYLIATVQELVRIPSVNHRPPAMNTLPNGCG
jgi:hypothetical protein